MTTTVATKLLQQLAPHRRRLIQTAKATTTNTRSIMGSVFGKESVEEPKFDILFNQNNVATPYEIRKYGERFAAEVSWSPKDDNDKSMGQPFGILAKYIGVFGSPENEGSVPISMTAPVVIEDDKKTEPTKIAMTAPVVMEDTDDGEKMMKFMLPSKYDDISQIPKPTDPRVTIEQIPSQVGAVHTFNGSMSAEKNKEMAKALADQLMKDGIEGITEEAVLENYQYWGYNPPFTIPYFRRNEIWVELTQTQVDHLLNKLQSDASN